MSSINNGSKIKYPWTSHKVHYMQALNYMQKRKLGIIQSIKTPWRKFNASTINGFELNSITIIAGRPASGKTLLVDQIVREAFKLNSKMNLRVLQFNFEMLGRTTKIREFSAITKLTYKQLCSVDEENPLSNDIIKKCLDHVKTKTDDNLDIVDTPQTVEGIKKIIQQYMEVNSYKDVDKYGRTIKVYRNTLITLDHSVLVKKAKTDANKHDVLYNLGEMLTEVKKMYPIAFIILSQLNREVEAPERQKDGSYGNYILEGDIFGADALMQHADFVFGINRPAKRFIKYYGPMEYIIEDESVLVIHSIKTRNGDNNMFFMRAVFENMSIEDMQTPGVKPKPKRELVTETA